MRMVFIYYEIRKFLIGSHLVFGCSDISFVEYCSSENRGVTICHHETLGHGESNRSSHKSTEGKGLCLISHGSNTTHKHVDARCKINGSMLIRMYKNSV